MHFSNQKALTFLEGESPTLIEKARENLNALSKISFPLIFN